MPLLGIKKMLDHFLEFLFKILYVSFLLEETLMVKDFKSVNSEVDFFPKIETLWIQVQILFIFHVTIAL
ncbi:unnamed protein product [Spirodela intermedia]|uniref:Uncharacterized protein n=1 Tax=Spirodela intermedia TaxID=51605 RepID=A0A7I8KPJ7_SPIIN|nr:unnamed protein product [Spirodela intermedia]